MLRSKYGDFQDVVVRFRKGQVRGEIGRLGGGTWLD